MATNNTGNLPIGKDTIADGSVKQVFDAYYDQPLEFTATEVDSTIAFFEKRGFEQSAARSTGSALLRQAKIDNVPIFKVLDTLKGLNEVQLSAVVTEVLNYSRQKTSTLGFTVPQPENLLEIRNIIA